jgi:cholesterol oxidase
LHDRGWLPKLGLKGILRLTIFKDIFVASGCGVGGGSLGYANTLYRARRAFYSDRQWADLGDWEAELGPHYDEAERMLGVTTYDEDSEADLLLKADAQERGFGETYAKTRVRVFLGEPDTTVPDPYFGGEGPNRAGCIRCGSCMVGAAITPRTRWSRTTSTSPNVGASRSCRSAPWSTSARGSLPRVSDRLGHLVRTNSEPILTVIAPDDARDFIRAVAITSSIYPDPDTHIEPVTYGRGADSQSLLFFLMTEAGTRRNQPVQLALNMLRHPRLALGAMWVQDKLGGSAQAVSPRRSSRSR